MKLKNYLFFLLFSLFLVGSLIDCLLGIIIIIILIIIIIIIITTSILMGAFISIFPN